MNLIVSIISILISLTSVTIAIISLRRTGLYQKFDYFPRIDIIDESIRFGRPSLVNASGIIADSVALQESAFEYNASLTNKGEKVIPIERVYIDYGSENHKFRIKHIVDGAFNLSKGNERKISFCLSYADTVDAMQKLKISNCCFWLRVTYADVAGKKGDITRSLGGFNGQGITFISQAGEILK